MNLTQEAQKRWDWTVAYLEKQCKLHNTRVGKQELAFERISPPFQARVSGSSAVDIVFTPASNEWTASTSRGHSMTLRVCESPSGYAELYEVKADNSVDTEEPYPKGNAAKDILKMALAK